MQHHCISRVNMHSFTLFLPPPSLFPGLNCRGNQTRYRAGNWKCQQHVEQSLPLPPQPNIPSDLHSTTIFHVIPSSPTPESPPSTATPLILALSLGPTPWLRTRYIRTKAFMSPPPSSSSPRATSIFPWQNRIATAMHRGLPYLIKPDTLVTRGPTQLNDVLGGDELADERGRSIVSVIEQPEIKWILSKFGRGTGDVSAFVVSIDSHGKLRRRARMNARGFITRQMCLAGDVPVVLMWKKAFLGGVDVRYGTKVIVLGDKPYETVVKGVLLFNVRAHDEGGIVTLSAFAANSDVIDNVQRGDGGARAVDVVLSEKSSEISDVSCSGVPVSRGFSASGFAEEQVVKENDQYFIQSPSLCYGGDAGSIISGVATYAGSKYLSAITSMKGGSRMLLFDRDVGNDPICTIGLVGLKDVISNSSCWVNQEFEWSEENSKIVKSSWELFDAKDWNDIDSSFSSLGLRL